MDKISAVLCKINTKSKLLNEILILLAIILFAIIGLFFIPLDYISYKRSLYYKNERRKYTLFDGVGVMFDLYNEIYGNGLPIRYIPNPKDKSVHMGWFVLQDTLIILNDFWFFYDAQQDTWIWKNDEDSEALMTLDEYIQSEIEGTNHLAGEVICNKAVVLIDTESLDDPELAKKEKRFLVYKDDRLEVLKEFCNRTE